VLLDQLTSQATHDALTGVGNRYALDEMGQRHVTDDADVVVVGIDGLVAYTSAHGHAESDGILVRVAAALCRRFAGAYGIVRLDSDEFAIVVPRLDGIDELAIAAQDAAAEAMASGVESTVRLSVTSGAASGRPLDRDLFDPVGRAQRARHLASITPNISVRVYDDQLQASDERDRLIDERLITAIPAGEIVPHFQPIVDVASGLVSGVEALARWTDPLLGVVNPDEFIGRAEATGQIGALGLCVLRQSVQAATTLGLEARDIAMGVNVSPSQLRRRYRDGGGYADKVSQVLAESGLRPRSLVVEVTESMLIEEHDPAIDELRRLHDLGVSIAIDDFGSGYWALGYFRWLDADIVKIDRSLVVQLAHDARSKAVVASIVGLAERMGMRTIAEGVEDEEVARAAEELGVSALQGWVYSRAVPLVQLPRTIDLLNRSSGVRPVMAPVATR
jgi:diguanylate cyclase